MRRAPRQTSPMVTVLGFLAIVAALHFAQSLFIPLALAGLLSLLLVPLVRRFEHWGVGPVIAVAATTTLALVLVATFGWVLMNQIADVAENLPRYRTNIIQKTESLGDSGKSLTMVFKNLQGLADEVVRSAEAKQGVEQAVPEAPKVTVVEPRTRTVEMVGSFVLAVAHALGTAAIVLILVAFLLIYRRDLGDRLIHVFGRGSVNLTSHAMGTAAENVSQYLLMQAIVNGSFGLFVTLGLLALGVPNAILWGLAAALLRFIPYIGVWFALVVPLLLSLALSESWTRPLLLVGYWLVLEIVVANVVEPLVYGRKTAVSPLGVMLGALFWTWLWGPAGLVLAVPMTASVFVLGRSIPQLAFLDTLFGSTTELEPRVQIYHRLLGMDSDAAVALADEYRKEKSLVEVLDSMVIPALGLAELDRHRGDLDEDRATALRENLKSLVEDLAETPANKPRKDETAEVVVPPDAPPILLIPAADDADEVVALMLKECLSRRGFTAEVVSAATPTAAKVRAVGDRADTVVCISALPPSASAPSLRLYKRIRSASPDAKIILGLWTVDAGLEPIKERVGADRDARLVSTLAAALKEIRAPVPAA